MSRVPPRPAGRSEEPIDIVCKRVYEGATPVDGWRVLVERLWPRGVRRGDAALDEWAKSLAPSAGLRRWYGHDRARWAEFRRRYLAELDGHEGELRRLREMARQRRVTLVFAARDEEFSSAAILRERLLDRAGEETPPSGRSGVPGVAGRP